ncbi:hypothetical protein [uncultured Chryseobacterium sp.]|uniref:hypothetical protein n=1 Tax=uncultured Chryseobacterium sp. TaxID=259322 RepID=UPI0025EBBCB2|nr:hypothetical protein [uncultured Chryseobacterium sp.]
MKKVTNTHNNSWIGICKFRQSLKAMHIHDLEKSTMGTHPLYNCIENGTAGVKKLNRFVLKKLNNDRTSEDLTNFYSSGSSQSTGIENYTSDHLRNDIAANSITQSQSWGFIAEFQQ